MIILNYNDDEEVLTVTRAIDDKEEEEISKENNYGFILHSNHVSMFVPFKELNSFVKYIHRLDAGEIPIV